MMTKIDDPEIMGELRKLLAANTAALGVFADKFSLTNDPQVSKLLRRNVDMLSKLGSVPLQFVESYRNIEGERSTVITMETETGHIGMEELLGVSAPRVIEEEIRDNFGLGDSA